MDSGILGLHPKILCQSGGEKLGWCLHFQGMAFMQDQAVVVFWHKTLRPPEPQINTETLNQKP